MLFLTYIHEFIPPPVKFQEFDIFFSLIIKITLSEYYTKIHKNK